MGVLIESGWSVGIGVIWRCTQCSSQSPTKSLRKTPDSQTVPNNWRSCHSINCTTLLIILALIQVISIYHIGNRSTFSIKGFGTQIIRLFPFPGLCLPSMSKIGFVKVVAGKHLVGPARLGATTGLNSDTLSTYPRISPNRQSADQLN